MTTRTRITYRDPARDVRSPRRGIVDGDVLAALLLTAPAFAWVVARTLARHGAFDAGATVSAGLVVVAVGMLVRAVASFARARHGGAPPQSR
jgi:hypothetical protein